MILIQDGTKTDIFSLGVLLFTMYFYSYPWEDKYDSDLEKNEIYKHLC